MKATEAVLDRMVTAWQGSKPGKAARAEDERCQEATRTKDRAELDREEEADLAGVKQRSPGLQKRQDDLTKALHVVEERRQLLQRDIAHDGSERYRHELQRDRLEEALRETADPTILEFIDRLNGERDKLRHYNIGHFREETGKIDLRAGGAPITQAFSEVASLKRRFQGLRDAIEAAQALQLQVGIDVPKRLAEIANGIPQIKAELVA